MSTLRIILQLVRHIPTKWFSDNQYSYDIYIYIYIYIIISRSLHGFPWFSFTIRLYHLSFPAGLPNYILCPNRAVVDKFLLVVQHFARPCEGGPWENVTYEFVLTSSTASCMSCWSYLRGFRDEWSVVVQLLFCGMLLTGFVQYSS